MAEGYWIIRTYRAGNVGEKIKYWVPEGKATKSSRKMKSDIKKIQQNEASAVKRLARCINANFRHGDYLIGLDYSEEKLAKLEERAHEGAADEAAAMDALRKLGEQELRNCLRRVKRAMQADGKELRYVAVTSDMDGKTGETKRLHHHLILNQEALPYFREKWKAGGAYDSCLRRMDDYTPLAEYLLAQVRRVPDEKKYMSSRNLIRVTPKDRVAKNGSLVRPPKGTVLVHMNEFRLGEPQYIRYIFRE